MAFVPEGQADRSQARSAWVALQKAPRPEGTVDRFNRPLGRGFYTDDSRHFVPGYYRAIPLGTKTIRPSKRLALCSRLWVNPGLSFLAPSASGRGPKSQVRRDALLT
jgi:hypothetical protein